jgi:hypothetical protein
VKVVSLVSGGADKQLVKHSFQEGQKMDDMDPFKFSGKEMSRNKIFSMEIGGNCILTGHDRNLCLREATNFENIIWEKRPDPSRKAVPDHMMVMVDPQGKLAVTSTTDK